MIIARCDYHPSLGCVELQLLLDTLFESRQVHFGGVKSVLLQLQKEAMLLFQFSFQDQLQLWGIAPETGLALTLSKL